MTGMETMNLVMDVAQPVMEPSELLGALRWRYATKRFDPSRKIPDPVWNALEESLTLTPSAFGLQPWTFLVVTDPATKTRLREVSWNQPQVEDCSHLVVFAARRSIEAKDIDRLIDRVAAVRGVPAASLSGYRDMMAGSLLGETRPDGAAEWSARQTYIALGQFIAAAAVLGIDACPMEGLDPVRYDEILGLVGTDYHVLAACPVGYRAGDDGYAALPKVRFPIEEVIQRR